VDLRAPYCWLLLPVQCCCCLCSAAAAAAAAAADADAFHWLHADSCECLHVCFPQSGKQPTRHLHSLCVEDPEEGPEGAISGGLLVLGAALASHGLLQSLVPCRCLCLCQLPALDPDGVAVVQVEVEASFLENI